MAKDTRSRMIDTTARLLLLRGYYGTALSDILAESGAPRGSLYFHFPGGKDELVLAATQASADATTAALVETLARAGVAAGASVHRGGTYLCMEGPQFSTRAESFLYRSWGVDVIGMTNLQEAKLAREAEICYATLAMVTDYDCWHDTHESVTAEAILAVLHANVAMAQAALRTNEHLP